MDGIKWAQVVLYCILAPSITSASESSKLLILTTILFVSSLFFIVLWNCFFPSYFKSLEEREMGVEEKEFLHASSDDGMWLCLLVCDAKVLPPSRPELFDRAFCTDRNLLHLH